MQIKIISRLFQLSKYLNQNQLTLLSSTLKKIPFGKSLIDYYHFKLIDPDIFFISFPKCGRTWLRVMLIRVLQIHYGLSSKNLLDPIFYAPHLPKILKFEFTHDDDPYLKKPNELETSKKKYKDKKIIFLARDPRDVVVSYFFENTKRMINYDPKHVFTGSLSEFLYEKTGSFESIISFYNIWAKNKKVPKDFLLVRYEDLHSNPKFELKKILNFFGIQEISDNEMQSAIEFSSFDNMHRMEENESKDQRLKPVNHDDHESYKTRKGKVKGFIDYLDEKDIQNLNRLMKEKLSKMYNYDN